MEQEVAIEAGYIRRLGRGAEVSRPWAGDPRVGRLSAGQRERCWRGVG